jgi:hypothetical protein
MATSLWTNLTQAAGVGMRNIMPQRSSCAARRPVADTRNQAVLKGHTVACPH